MKIKYAVLVVLTMLISVCGMRAEGTNGWPSVTFKSAYANKYLAFGSGAVLYDEPVMQSDLFIAFNSGLYIDFWNSKSFSGKWNGNLGNEIDYGIGWAGKVHGFNVDIGITYFDEPKMFNLKSGDIIYTHATISRECRKYLVSWTWENYITMPNTGFQGGNLISARIYRGFQLIDGKATLNLSTALVYDDGGFGFDDGFLQKGNVGIDWKITEQLTLNAPSVNYYVPLSVHDARKTDTVIFAGLTYKF